MDIIKVMVVRSFVGRLSPAGAVDFAKEAMKTVDQCTECGEYVERCPYSLPIPELLKENSAFFQKLVEQVG